VRYRGELEALNALIERQERTNQLLEQLIELQTSKETVTPIIDKQKRQYNRRSKENAS